MKYLVLVSHGGLAEGLKSSLAMFAGDKIDQVIAVGLKEGKSVDDFAHDFGQALAPLTDEDSVLVLADIVGGSPLTTAATVLDEQGKLSTALILGGMNLTMALTAVVMKDMMEGADLAQVILSEASTALQEFTLAPVEGDDDEEDDI
ncbi:PTS fructose transporter subunit IIA [Streptococcus xiaochunlingii]|jgi:PTS system, sugar-specific enzyme IIA component|uniref:PTS sugar transporter subunit IIA n=1 Tax=Streptococcus xiaochunlingii TaxID=2589788 RepID=UPI00345B00D6